MLSHKREGNGNGPRCVMKHSVNCRSDSVLSTPILSLQNFNLGFIVDTDASGGSLRAVFSQVCGVLCEYGPLQK